MSLFDNLGGAQQSITPQAALQQLKANPVQMLKNRGINIPEGMTNPQQIIQYMVKSGQLPQNRLTQAMQMIRGMRR